MRTVVKRALSVVPALALTVGLAGAGAVAMAADEGTASAYHLCGWRPGGCWNHPR